MVLPGRPCMAVVVALAAAGLPAVAVALAAAGLPAVAVAAAVAFVWTVQSRGLAVVIVVVVSAWCCAQRSAVAEAA